MSLARHVRVHHSISTKLLLAVFSVYMVVTVIVTATQMVFAYKGTQHYVNDGMSRLQQMLTPALNHIYLQHEHGEIPLVLETLLNSRLLMGLKFEQSKPTVNQWISGEMYTIDPNTTYQHIRQNTSLSPILSWFYSQFYQPTIYRFPYILYTPRTAQLVVSGEVTFYSDTSVILEDVNRAFKTIIISAVIVSITLWVFLLLAGYFYFTKPLRVLTYSLTRVARGRFTDVKVKGFDTGGTEIDILANAFNTMVDKVTSAQQSLTKAQHHLSQIIDMMPSLMVAVTAKGVVTDWNVQAENLTGVSRQVAIGSHYSIVIPFLEAHQNIIDEAILNQKRQEITHALFVIQGEKRYFDLIVYSFEEQEGGGAVIRLDDVTAQQQLQEVFVQTEKMTSVGRLAAGMAHEINNPLGVILQNTQNIRRRLDPALAKNQEEAKNLGVDLVKVGTYLEHRDIWVFLDSIRDSGERAAKIVSNLLRFSRKSASALTLSNLTDIIEKAVELVLTDYELKKEIDVGAIELQREYDANLSAVWCEPSEIQQVLLNLLKNSAQAMFTDTEKQVTHRIILRTYNDEKYAYIEVEDNGPGIPEQIRKRVFEPFFTTKEVGKGTGLGLSVCYHIITESHQGIIKVESTLGMGTKFIIALPLVRE